jgi:hypothetical protein
MQDFMLTDRETRTLLELLETQERTLDTEIQHCSTRAMKEKLEDRLHVVERLIERFDEVDQPLNP